MCEKIYSNVKIVKMQIHVVEKFLQIAEPTLSLAIDGYLLGGYVWRRTGVKLRLHTYPPLLGDVY